MKNPIKKLTNAQRYAVILKTCMYHNPSSKPRSCDHKDNKEHKCLCKNCPYLHPPKLLIKLEGEA